MAKDAGALISILGRGGHLYVCGDGGKMAPDVEATPQKAYQSVRETDERQAQEWLLDLQTKGIYAKDVWAGFDRFDEKDWMTPVLFYISQKTFKFFNPFAYNNFSPPVGRLSLIFIFRF